MFGLDAYYPLRRSIEHRSPLCICRSRIRNSLPARQVHSRIPCVFATLSTLCSLCPNQGHAVSSILVLASCLLDRLCNDDDGGRSDAVAHFSVSEFTHHDADGCISAGFVSAITLTNE